MAWIAMNERSFIVCRGHVDCQPVHVCEAGPRVPRRAAQEIERTLSPTEQRAYREAPIPAAEREEMLALVRWFTNRYPTAAERLAYCRRAYRRWRVSASRS